MSLDLIGVRVSDVRVHFQTLLFGKIYKLSGAPNIIPLGHRNYQDLSYLLLFVLSYFFWGGGIIYTLHSAWV